MRVVGEVVALEELIREASARHEVADRVLTAHLPTVAADRTLLSELFHALLGAAASAPEPRGVVVTGHRLADLVVVELSGAGDCASFRRSEPADVAEGIVQRHGGTFEVGEGPGGTGTTVRFTLPAAAGSRSEDGTATAVPRQVEVA